MATINQILHRKNDSGTYDTVYLQANMANVTGTLGIAHGGTGATFSTAQNNAIIKMADSGGTLVAVSTKNGALYATGDNGIPKFGTLPVAQGGTGATSASGALTALGAAASSHSHTASQVTFENNTLYNIGDDAMIGDQNVTGAVIVQGINGPGSIEFRNTDGSKRGVSAIVSSFDASSGTLNLVGS